MAPRAPQQLQLFDPIRSRPIVRDPRDVHAPRVRTQPPSAPLSPPETARTPRATEPLPTGVATSAPVNALLPAPTLSPAQDLSSLPPPPREVVVEKAERLASRLSRVLGLRVRLAVTDNRSTMLSFKRNASALQVRLHHMFLDAPEDVVSALADYTGRGRRKAGTVLDAFIQGMQPRIRQERHPAEPELQPRGRCYDLQDLFDRVNAEHFDNGIVAQIGWGRRGPKRMRKSIRLGVYDHQTREIRIHPALDRPEVPRFFVEYIVFHEMLHQLFPSPAGAARRIHHPPAFRARERQYPHYEASVRWEKENLRLLLRG